MTDAEQDDAPPGCAEGHSDRFGAFGRGEVRVLLGRGAEARFSRYAIRSTAEYVGAHRGAAEPTAIGRMGGRS